MSRLVAATAKERTHYTKSFIELGAAACKTRPREMEFAMAQFLRMAVAKGALVKIIDALDQLPETPESQYLRENGFIELLTDPPPWLTELRKKSI